MDNISPIHIDLTNNLRINRHGSKTGRTNRDKNAVQIVDHVPGWDTLQLWFFNTKSKYEPFRDVCEYINDLINILENL